MRSCYKTITFVLVSMLLLCEISNFAALAAADFNGQTMSHPMVAHLLEVTGTVIEIGGIAIMVLGALLSTTIFFRDWGRKNSFEGPYKAYRTNLGRAILLGLEVLIVADIVGTVAVTPSLENLSILGLIVLIRTFLSFTLEVEINGYWPWQEATVQNRISSGDSRS